MKWGLIGYGSIGKRHAENIQFLHDELVVVTNNKNCTFPRAVSIEDLIKNHQPDIVLISNETSKHVITYQEIRALAPDIPILIEKPLFEKQYDFKNDPFAFGAYCLRFHPLVLNLQEKIKDQKIISARFYAGQYLPTWRPDRDYRTTYSAKKELGGGVLRDLSHELDLASYLLGDLELLFSDTAKVSNLEISTDDLFIAYLKSKDCPSVLVEMNYLDHISQRYMTMITNELTIRVDFLNKEINTNQQIEKFEYSNNIMYLNMLKAIRSGSHKQLSSFKDGMSVLEIISQVES